VAARILLDFDADAEKIRNEIMGMLSGAEYQAVQEISPEPESYLPGSPPFDPIFRAEIERLRAEKKAAIEAHDFGRAAGLRNREFRLTQRGRELEAIWRDDRELRPRPTPTPRPTPVSGVKSERALIVAVVLSAASFPVGLLVGWLIWA
jgi:uncharacterized membrane protein YccC